MKLRSPFKTISSGNSKIFLRPRPKPARIRSKLRTNANAGKLKVKSVFQSVSIPSILQWPWERVDQLRHRGQSRGQNLRPWSQRSNQRLNIVFTYLFLQMMACQHDFVKVAIFHQTVFNLWPDLKSRRGRRSPRRTSASTPRTTFPSKLSLRRRRSRQRRQQQAIPMILQAVHFLSKSCRFMGIMYHS